MRLSVALNNGAIRKPSEVNWIHHNNQTWMPSLREALTAKYAFVILRCPFRRLASVYLDKVVDKNINAWFLHDAINREMELEDMSFTDFVGYVTDPRFKFVDIHWRAQADFLIFDKYDAYFSMEHFGEMVSALESNIGFKVVDARDLVGHHAEKHERVSGRTFDLSPVREIAAMKQEGKLPSYRSMFSPILYKTVEKAFKKDLTVYRKHCDPADILKL